MIHSRFIRLFALILGSLAFENEVMSAPPPVPTSLYDIPVETLTGKKETLAPYKGKVLLIVNTASECGFTPQYEGLQKVYEKYSDKGFVILGFPSNNFGAQEPGSNAEIKDFCERKFKVKFPMFAKGDVGGKDSKSGDELTQPVYRYLLKNAETHEAIKWNFEKFLLGKDGKVLGRFKSNVKPESEELAKAIETALAAK